MQIIRNDTFLFADMVPPILKGLVKNMYDCGLLKVSCTAWRRVGFNESLADALLATFRDPNAMRPPVIIPVPRPGLSPTHKTPGKRGSGPEEQLGVGSHKKRKGA